MYLVLARNLLLTARAHNKTSNYLMSMDPSMLTKDSAGFLGKVRANFLGTEFTIYDKVRSYFLAWLVREACARASTQKMRTMTRRRFRCLQFAKSWVLYSMFVMRQRDSLGSHCLLLMQESTASNSKGPRRVTAAVPSLKAVPPCYSCLLDLIRSALVRMARRQCSGQSSPKNP